jgi:hypothetical protein
LRHHAPNNSRWVLLRLFFIRVIRVIRGEAIPASNVDGPQRRAIGGQKRNKTSSAVRVRHPPSGLLVIAEESRSQHENRARALRRLRQALYLKVRDELTPQALTDLATRPDYAAARDGAGRLHPGHKDPRFWPVVGLVLDVLQAVGARVSEAAEFLGISTGNLIDFLHGEDKVWEQANQMRVRFGLKTLR